MRNSCAGLTALLFFFAAPMGCTGPTTDGVVDTDTNTTTDDTGDPADYVTISVTVHAAIDGLIIDPVGVCLHEAEGDIGEEPVLATAEVTGQAITVNVLKAGETARAWIGPATASHSSDGYRVLEFDGRQWVHPIADFSVSATGCDETQMNMVDNPGCEPTVNLNGYFPEALHHCEFEQHLYDDSQPDFKGDYIGGEEGDFMLEVTEGQYIMDPNGVGIGGFLGTATRSYGSGFEYYITDDDVWTSSSVWLGNGFTLDVVDNETIVNTLTCTVL